MRLIITAAFVIIVDQLSKYLVATLMETGQSIALINNFLYITYVRNPGAAFGIFPYQTVVLIVITLIVVLLILYYYRIFSENHRWIRFALALQLGGAVGNLIDRVRVGWVVDFIDFTVWPPVFNLADSAIVVGIGILLIAFWRDPELRIKRS